MNEFLEQFLLESRELIVQATDDLLALEHRSDDAARLDSAFRAIHTLKGAAGIMDFAAMAQLCHAAEDRLGAVRSTIQAMTPALVTDCLACLDQITAWLAVMEETQALPEAAEAQTAALIARIAPGHGSAGAAPPAVEPIKENGTRPGISADAVEILREQVEVLALPQDAGATGRTTAAVMVIRNVLRRASLIPGAAEELNAGKPGSGAIVPDAVAAARPMRTDLARIDALMRLSGELVVLKNALGHGLELALADGLPKPHSQNFTQAYSRLDRLSADLLRASQATRVLPLRQVFQRFPRLVREMAAEMNKKVRLVTEGDATEADRLIVEGLFEPVLHALRNAVDHGVETAEQRAAAGKPDPAIIRLTAARIGEQVVVEIADDGRGIDPAAIRATAEARGLASKQALAAMPDAALLEMIFAPGFSTARSVSKISGRGVGMDAVRAAIRELSGSVDVDSKVGEGTIIRFHLPFTVVLTRVLNVDAGGQAFGFPFETVAETLQISAGQVARLGAAETVLWRGQTLPLIDLTQLLNLPDTATAQTLQAVIVAYPGGFAALRVERFGKQVEVMLKPLEGLLAGMRGVAGTALLGDGRVLIVLEPHELLQ